METIIVEGPQAAKLQSAIGDVQAEVIASLVGIDKMISSLMAWRAELVEQAHQWATVNEDAVVPFGVSAVRQTELARRSFVAEIACALHIPESTADQLIGESDLLVNGLPDTLDELRHGRIGYQQARVIVGESHGLDADIRAKLEAALIGPAGSLTASRLRVRARRVREQLEPDSIEARTKTALEKRFIGVDPGRDGMSWLTLYGQAAVIEGIDDRLQRAATAKRAAGDPRTISQLRADIAAALLLDGVPGLAASHPASAGSRGEEPSGGDSVGDPRAADGGAEGRSGANPDPVLASLDFPVDLLDRIRPQVMVTVPVFNLMGLTEEPGSLSGCVPIDADTARRLAAHAPSFTRLLTHPQTEAVLSVGRDSYRVPADLRQWLRIRDGMCRFPGCTRRAVHTEIDHTGQWQADGLTQYDNLACLCAKHHHLKDQTVWQVVQRGNGILEWTSPAGRTYRTEPETNLPTPPGVIASDDSGGDRHPPDTRPDRIMPRREPDAKPKPAAECEPDAPSALDRSDEGSDVPPF